MYVMGMCTFFFEKRKYAKPNKSVIIKIIDLSMVSIVGTINIGKKFMPIKKFVLLWFIESCDLIFYLSLLLNA